MRTNIVLDDDLIERALALSRFSTKKDVIHEALRLYVKFMERRDLTGLSGRIQLNRDYDHKKLRDLR